MSQVEVAQALLSEAVSILYSSSRDNDFPENYVRSMAPSKMRHRLFELRNQKAPLASPSPAEPFGALGSESLDRPPHDDIEYRRRLELADLRVAEAVDALWQVGAVFALDYVEMSAQHHLAACLRQIRERETPSERAALVAQVSRLRASVGLEPIEWEQIVTGTSH